MSNTEAKVRELAKLSILSNRISEIHEKNLKAYPFLFFNGVKEASISYDLERGNSNYVNFDLTIGDEHNPNLEKRLEVLDKSIKNLFWKEVGVNVFINGKKAFDSTVPKETIEEVAKKVMEENKELFEDLAKLEEKEKKAKNEQD